MQVRIHIADKTELVKEEDVSTGVGADLFIRKKHPGPVVGTGYIIEIYENGIKVDEREIPLKKQIREVIDEYKEKYHTLRSFQNESQIHVTYKTKEERGESFPIQNPEHNKEIQPTQPKQNKPVMETKMETAMQEIDQHLLKKASQVQDLLQRLVNPTIPIKKRADAIDQGTVDFIPEAPIPGQAGVGAEKMEITISNQMIKKLITYINGKVGAPDDELYNGIKSWMSKVKKAIKNWERTNGQSLDRTLISQNIKDVVTSGDPNKIKQVSGIEIAPDTAALLQKITLMEVGTPQTGQSSLSESLEKVANIQDIVSKLVNPVNMAEGNSIPSTAVEVVKHILGENEVDIDELEKALPDNFSGNAIEQALKEVLDEGEGKPITVVEIRKKEFWSHVNDMKKTATIERAFEEWINKKGLSLEEAYPIWNRINYDIDAIFGNKKAWHQLSDDDLFRIFDSNSLLREYETGIANEVFRKNSEFVETNVTQPFNMAYTELKEIIGTILKSDTEVKTNLNNLLYSFTEKAIDINKNETGDTSMEAAFNPVDSIERIKEFLKNNVYPFFIESMKATYKSLEDSHHTTGVLASIRDDIWESLASLAVGTIIKAVEELAPAFIERFKTVPQGHKKIVDSYGTQETL